FLAVLIAGVSLACIDDLHGVMRVVEDTREAFGIAKEQGGAFVGGKAAGKPDGEGIGRKNFLGFVDDGLRSAAILKLHLQAAAGESDEALAAALVGTPKLAGG